MPTIDISHYTSYAKEPFSIHTFSDWCVEHFGMPTGLDMTGPVIGVKGDRWRIFTRTFTRCELPINAASNISWFIEIDDDTLAVFFKLLWPNSIIKA